MPRRAELAGVIRPEVDDRQLEQEAQQMESRLGKAAQLTPSIDTRKIQRQLERAIPGGGLIGTAVDAVRGTGAGGGGGGAGGAGDAISGAGNVELAQLEKLNDIHDELEKIGVSGGDSGGTTVVGTGGAGLLGGTAALAGGAVSLVGAGIGGARHALGQGMFGRAGRQTLQGRKKFEGLSGARNAMQDPLGALATGAKNLYDPSGLLETGVRAAGSKLRSAAPQSFVNEFDRGAKGVKNLPSEVRDIQIKKPQWLSNINLQKPTWLQNLGTLQEPTWLQNLGTLQQPSWLSQLDQNISIQKPPWLEALSNIGLNFNVDLPAPTFDIGTGQLERQLRNAFDDFRDDVVDDAVKQLKQEVTDGLGGV
ncbi:hypothetical protein [Haloarcula pellucida]|uniref:Uncharacterized protein n=1 Tax=Haloarcula pellucida TaxID=1427151 RepID=A0A830GR53_9EURY|nr:hypothetical protein [Halomicroarcula pellucida]MBX0350469.1 hypothetical protein [Halomicroarcula pellucida]GGO03478.1 hypothetical protein GCM10009030_39150 [Halomicroarcula pellucida]